MAKRARGAVAKADPFFFLSLVAKGVIVGIARWLELFAVEQKLFGQVAHFCQHLPLKGFKGLLCLEVSPR